MQTYIVRANAIGFVAMGFLAILAWACAFSTYWHESHASAKLALTNVVAFKQYRGSDRAGLAFDVEADLRSVWNWNVKQLFVYVKATYATEKYPRNEVVVWDKIVQTKEASKFRIAVSKSKYPLRDIGFGLRNAKVNLTLSYDIMPITGRLFIHDAGHKVFSMPASYQ